MTADGFQDGAEQRIATALSRHVDAGHLPGAAFGVSRRGETHVRAVGSCEVGGAPMPPDALFRITSMTRPITAFATLLLVERGLIALDEPVDRVLPELTDRRVLRALNGSIDDTVAATRSITLRDLLTMRGGFGMILAPPSEYPILQAEADLELCSAGPPVPATPHAPDEWMRRMGTLPLMNQPGEQWRYATGSMILGVLNARVAEQPLEDFYREAIFEPLGMHDTAFFVEPGDRHVLPPCYTHTGDALVQFDDDGTWTHPRPFPDGGAGLLSTAADYVRFGSALMRGTDGMISPDLLAQMTTDQLTAEQRAAAGPILDPRGWGFGVSIISPPADPHGPKGYGWSGGFGTVWWNDPDEELTAVLCTQVMFSEALFAAENDFASALYNALAD